MTLKQLQKTHRSYLAEFDRAVARRRRDLVRYFAFHIRERRKMANPNNSTTSRSQKMKKKMLNLMHRSVFNSAANPKCARWRKTRNGSWHTTNPRRCEA